MTDDLPLYTARQKLVEIERYLKIRREVYRRMIEAKAMSQNVADQRSDLLRAIAMDYMREAMREDAADQAQRAKRDDEAQVRADNVTILSGG